METKNITTFVLANLLNANDLKVLSASNADVPELNKTYTLVKCFYHIGYRIKDCKFAIHFKELNHGSLVGYDAKYFNPVDESGNTISFENAMIEVSKEENPKWMIKDGMIIPVEK